MISQTFEKKSFGLESSKRSIRNRKWENTGQQVNEKGTQKPC